MLHVYVVAEFGIIKCEELLILSSMSYLRKIMVWNVNGIIIMFLVL